MKRREEKGRKREEQTERNERSGGGTELEPVRRVASPRKGKRRGQHQRNRGNEGPEEKKERGRKRPAPKTSAQKLQTTGGKNKRPKEGGQPTKRKKCRGRQRGRRGIGPSQRRGEKDTQENTTNREGVGTGADAKRAGESERTQSREMERLMTSGMRGNREEPGPGDGKDEREERRRRREKNKETRGDQ